MTIQSEDVGFWADSESSDTEIDSSDQEFTEAVRAISYLIKIVIFITRAVHDHQDK